VAKSSGSTKLTCGAATVPPGHVHPDHHCGRGRRAAAVEHTKRFVAVAPASTRPARPEELTLVRVARLVHLEPLPHTRSAVR
jgi:hypothetical protein